MLNQRARPLAPGEWKDPEWRFVFRRMLNAMRDAGGVGLAAPQLGLNVRLLVYQVRQTPRYPSVSTTKPPRCLVNPIIEATSEENQLNFEGCLSYPELRGFVSRARQVTVRARNRHGESRSIQAEGFEARILQHEIDHLNGVLYPSRIDHFDHFGYVDEPDRDEYNPAPETIN